MGTADGLTLLQQDSPGGMRRPRPDHTCDKILGDRIERRQPLKTPQQIAGCDFAQASLSELPGDR